MRNLLVKLHRYGGLAIALFLVLAGLTGSVLAFWPELDEWLNPGFYHGAGGEPALTPEQLAARAEADDPPLRVWYLALPEEAGRSALLALVPRLDPASGEPYPGRDLVRYLDPASGAVLGERHWGECCFSREQLVPFLLEFHHNLTLPGAWGLWLMGGVAMLWVLDCLVALLLTLPRGRPFWQKWRPAWWIKRGHAYRTTLDIHRAGGLWLWLLLLPLALSSVAMNLPEPVFRPLVSLFSPVPPSVWSERSVQPAGHFGSSLRDFDRAYAEAARHAAALGLPGLPVELYHSAEYNFYGASFGAADSPRGRAWLYFDGSDGRLLGQEIPARGSLGERFYRLQLPIHSGRLLGLPGRLAIAVLGLAIAVLSVTGVLIWWRKRRARRLGRRKRRPAQASGEGLGAA